MDTSTVSSLQLVDGQKSKCSLQYWIMFLLLDWKQVLDHVVLLLLNLLNHLLPGALGADDVVAVLGVVVHQDED